MHFTAFCISITFFVSFNWVSTKPRPDRWTTLWTAPWTPYEAQKSQKKPQTNKNITLINAPPHTAHSNKRP